MPMYTVKAKTKTLNKKSEVPGGNIPDQTRKVNPKVSVGKR